MLKKLQKILVIFLMGTIFGGLIGISIRYPVDKTVVSEVALLCASGDYETFKIGITGKIYEVKCSDGNTLLFK